jgi:hypothetical protein
MDFAHRDQNRLGRVPASPFGGLAHVEEDTAILKQGRRSPRADLRRSGRRDAVCAVSNRKSGPLPCVIAAKQVETSRKPAAAILLAAT